MSSGYFPNNKRSRSPAGRLRTIERPSCSKSMMRGTAGAWPLGPVNKDTIGLLGLSMPNRPRCAAMTQPAAPSFNSTTEPTG